MYVFAGSQRKNDVGGHLKLLQTESGFVMTLKEVDILRGDGNDVTNTEHWDGLMMELKSGNFDVLIITPPCNTFSRARNTPGGPPPLRSKEWPWGFPWLAQKHLADCELGNTFLRKTYEACRIAHAADCAYLVEHPEDLGCTRSGDHPASIWAMQDTFDLQKDTSAATAGLFQCAFGAETSKPTRLLSTLGMKHHALSHGWPTFGPHGAYRGPLPLHCGHMHTPLLGRSNRVFVTAAAAAYPGDMCLWIANMVLEFCRQRPLLKRGEIEIETPRLQAPVHTTTFEPQPAPAAVGSLRDQEAMDTNEALKTDGALDTDGALKINLKLKPSEEDTSDEEEPGVPRPKLQDHPGGKGPPLGATWGGKARCLHDGAGLCSPGRWHPEARRETGWAGLGPLKSALLALLHKHLAPVPRLVFAMACGQVRTCPFSEELLRAGRELWFECLVRGGSSLTIEQLGQVAPYQPFYLSAIGETLVLIGDPDARIYHLSPESFTTGVAVGMGHRLPRTPAVFERKAKWRKYPPAEDNWDMGNYQSALGIGPVLQAQFEEEAALGLMYETSLDDAVSSFPGDRLRVAALGAIEKGDDTWRIVHDATHGVGVNALVVPRDQLRMPSAGDARSTMQLASMERPGVHFTLQGDVSKAHRRVLIRKQDWGLLACRASQDQSRVWINRVGTFGVGSAGYWWGRLAGGIARIAVAFCENEWAFQFIYADDLRWTCHGPAKYDLLLLLTFVWTLAGTPISWKKGRGGLALDWVGYWLDYGKFQVGISESRCRWLVAWAERILSNGVVLVRGLAEGLGRLCFTAGVLEFARPFLSPLYAWTSAAPAGSVLPLPPMIRLTLTWILQELKGGRRTTDCRTPAAQLGELFRTDAKGEEDYVVLGGWECRAGTPPGRARWFSVTLRQADAPWLFAKGHGSRTIAASEMLATLVAVLVFVEEGAEATGTFACSGTTDNLGNCFVVNKLMTTKHPLSSVLMALTTHLARRGLWLRLRWQARELNTEADDLTNDVFDKFDLGLRVPVVWGQLDLELMHALLAEGARLYGDLEELRAAKRLLPPPGGRSSYRGGKKAKTAWAG
jgi:hypothetical protein